ncbi:hypothetical protein PCANC_25190 [Puccinia coronata f. sp. avenae]|uniref:Uncharacterized protein n=1 Tax=Puccinia coronata f. sp. avenae TaxID=200324 RepID=A0A2N5TTL4_9BASI|nr:hypothetical protein PCANC_25190 [Puccinia coronata f. sp. avenae]
MELGIKAHQSWLIFPALHPCAAISFLACPPTSAITPSAIIPSAITPSAITPSAITPSAITPTPQQPNGHFRQPSRPTEQGAPRVNGGQDLFNLLSH